MSQCGKTTHCCFFDGEVCQFLTDSPEHDYKYACGLKLKYRQWHLVHASAEYLINVKQKMQKAGYIATDCGDWPPFGISCNDCGERR